MKKLFLLTILFLGSVSTIACAQNNKKYALVIGNASYEKSPLRNPLNDADDVSSKFRTLGFEVISAKDCKTRSDMRKVLNDFCKKASNAEAGVFYYSGHGMQLSNDGGNYLVPINAEMTDEADVSEECLSLNYVLKKMDENGINMKVAIIDACRDNPFRTWHRGNSKKGLSTPGDVPSGTFIAFATSANDVAADGKDRNSPFTNAFLSALNGENLEIDNVFKEVKRIVKENTNGGQRPWTSNDLSEHFYFSKNKNDSIIEQPKPFVPMIHGFDIGGRDITFGVSVGYVNPIISTTSGGNYTGSVVNYALGDESEDASYSVSGGFNVGAFADIRLYKNFYLKAGLEFSHYSYSNEFNKNVDRRILQTSQYYLGGSTENRYKEEYTINQIEVPLLGSYRIATNRSSHIQLNVGPVIYYGMSANMKLSGNTDTESLRAYKYTNLQFTSQLFDNSTYSSHYAGYGELNLYGKHYDHTETYTMGNNAAISKSYDLEESPLNKVNFGIRMGAAFEYAGISLGVEYNLMLTNMANKKFWESDRLTIFDQTPGTVMSGYKQRNSYLGVKLSYTFRY